MQNEIEELKGVLLAAATEKRHGWIHLPNEPLLTRAGSLLRGQTEAVVDEVTKTLCHCNRPVPVASLPLRKGPLCNFIDNLCPGREACAREVRGMALIVCYNCKKVCARLPARVDSKSGFEFKAGGIYHAAKCAACTPGTTESVVAEIRVHMRRKNR